LAVARCFHVALIGFPIGTHRGRRARDRECRVPSQLRGEP
jgi:hypothetical protein